MAGLLPADVTGIVTFEGKPASQDETFVARSFGCGESPVRHTENWKIGPKGELGDVVVWIAEPRYPATPAPPPPSETEIKQVGCRYEPHVVVSLAGRNVAFINGDPTLHNVLARAYAGTDQPPGPNVFNFGQSYLGQRDERTFNSPGLYSLQCSVHSWMQAWVRVLSSPCYAVTGADGTFKLFNGTLLLDGTYRIQAWHPRFAQPLEQTVTVAHGAARTSFIFHGAQSF